MEGTTAAPAEQPPVAAAAALPAEQAGAHTAKAEPATPAAQQGRATNSEANRSPSATPVTPSAEREGDGAKLMPADAATEHLNDLQEEGGKHKKEDHAAVELLKWTASFAIAFGAPHDPPQALHSERVACRTTACRSLLPLLLGQAPSIW